MANNHVSALDPSTEEYTSSHEQAEGEHYHQGPAGRHGAFDTPSEEYTSSRRGVQNHQAPVARNGSFDTSSEVYTNSNAQDQPAGLQNHQNAVAGAEFAARLAQFGHRNKQPRQFQGDIAGIADTRRLGRRGGPSISHIRGFYQRRVRAPFKQPKEVTDEHEDFTHRLKAYNIFFPSWDPVHQESRYRRPNNLAEIQRALNEHTQPSLRHIDYVAWRRAVQKCPNDESMIWPIFQFSGPANIQAMGISFDQMMNLTEYSVRAPMPDLYDGIDKDEIDPIIKARQFANDSMSNTLFPVNLDPADDETGELDEQAAPVAPNFFVQYSLEEDISVKQAAHHGAYGAHAMNTLRTIANDSQPIFDNNAYTFTVIFHRGRLSIWAHFVRKPHAGDYMLDYVPFLVVNDVDMMRSRENFERGVRFFRNARRLAERYRTELVDAANRHVRPARDTPDAGDDNDDGDGEGDGGSDVDVNNVAEEDEPGMVGEEADEEDEDEDMDWDDPYFDEDSEDFESDVSEYQPSE